MDSSQSSDTQLASDAKSATATDEEVQASLLALLAVQGLQRVLRRLRQPRVQRVLHRLQLGLLQWTRIDQHSKIVSDIFEQFVPWEAQNCGEEWAFSR